MRGAGLILVLLLALPMPGFAQGGADKAPVKGIGAAKEGDIVTVRGQEFRLFGIDAPDRGQTCVNVRGQNYDCFALSTRILSLLINNMNVECTPRGESPARGPTLAVCRAENGDDLAYAMVERGMALAYRPLSFDYVSIEVRAISYRRGLWGGRVEPPWLWRSRETEKKLDEMRKPKKAGAQ
ncbi:MAG: thermonuclease family protein [Niveispirillum sp.]|uniref:thermonuclease family protein n=1 Tax=Niveispirillum sp. TaxID=1917217 RepID=UPI003BA5A23A